MKVNEKRQIQAKSCYGHLGGTLGNRLFERLLELNWFEREADKTTVYKLTDTGEKALRQLGVDIYKKGP